ncbi:MAG: hypothetical protein ACJAYU_003812 [Bradymonadia bacterium]|jgi:hypothetical protein
MNSVGTLVLAVGFVCLGDMSGPCGGGGGGRENPDEDEVQQTLGDVDLALSCTNSGGTGVTVECCASTAEFPDTCSIGACGCSPEDSEPVGTCGCGGDQCFDGVSYADVPGV